jgi:hypothetical protein
MYGKHSRKAPQMQQLETDPQMLHMTTPSPVPAFVIR